MEIIYELTKEECVEAKELLGHAKYRMLAKIAYIFCFFYIMLYNLLKIKNIYNIYNIIFNIVVPMLTFIIGN